MKRSFDRQNIRAGVGAVRNEGTGRNVGGSALGCYGVGPPG